MPDAPSHRYRLAPSMRIPWAAARVVNRGKNVGYIECDVTDQDAKLVARQRPHASSCAANKDERFNRWRE